MPEAAGFATYFLHKRHHKFSYLLKKILLIIIVQICIYYLFKKIILKIIWIFIVTQNYNVSKNSNFYLTSSSKLLCEVIISFIISIIPNLNLRKIRCHWIDRVCDLLCRNISSTWEAVMLRIDLCIFLVSQLLLSLWAWNVASSSHLFFESSWRNISHRPSDSGRPGSSHSWNCSDNKPALLYVVTSKNSCF